MIKVEVKKREPVIVIRMSRSKAQDLYICADRASKKAVGGFFSKNISPVALNRITGMFRELWEALEKSDL